MKKLSVLVILIFSLQVLIAQYIPKEFGKGINIIGKDSTFTLKFGVRFQTLMTGDLTVNNDDLGQLEDFKSSFLIRRSRFKFNGYAYTPKLKYKMEFGLTNRDIGGGINPEHNYASRIILDAYIDWNFYRNFSVKIGQAKLPGNRERVISSANLQLVDRSRLNKHYNIDRDVGIQLKHNFKIGKHFIIKEIFAFTQGEGRNITSGNIGGYDYTFRVELLPFGNFLKKGDYVGGATVRENKPKIAIGLTLDTNIDAPRERGQLGDFVYNDDGSYGAKTLNTFFADLMFKYKAISVMVEYVNKSTSDGNAYLFDNMNDTKIIGTYFIGSGLSLQSGVMLNSTTELTGRYTTISPQVEVSNNEEEYTIGLSKYISGHQLKVQTDFSYRKNSVTNNLTENRGKDDVLFGRLQIDIHF